MSPEHRVAEPVGLGALAEAVRTGGLDVQLHGLEREVFVHDVVHDARRATPGSLFVCVPGTVTDGHEHAAAAIGAGAVALVTERRLDLGVPEIQVESCRRTMGPLAAAFFDHPADALDLVAVTGTNGKTTVTHLLAAICRAAEIPAAAIGTLTGLHTTPTTPEAIDLQRHLAALRSGGTRVVALEVSSHALVQHRFDGATADLAIFTNLSRDHLDFHKTMEAYFQAKASLFEPERARAALVNLDDPHGRLLADAAVIPTEGFGLADVEDLTVARDSSRFRWDGATVTVRLPGRFNVSNALAAAGAARHLGIERDCIVAGLETVPGVPGRLERVSIDAPFDVLVDYAHTPDALANVLDAAREMGGRVLVVFGCGGDKDRTKRAPMGEVATRLADHVVITSDNPRSEDPDSIIEEIRRGIVAGASVEVEPDRRRAIAAALVAADAGDLVVVAGKGHEAEQVIGDRRIPFDDRAVVVEEFERLLGTRR